MSGAEGVMFVNIGAATLFAAGYTILALANPSQRAALGFAANYFVGMLTPLADLATPRLGLPAITEWVGYLAFLVSTAAISITYALFHERPAPWRACAAILVIGVVCRASIGLEVQDTLLYGLGYQIPFALAAALAAHTVITLRAGSRPLAVALASVFAIIGALDLAKPFLSLALGQGRTLETYVHSPYALVSQVSSGILLLAAGLLLLLVVAQKAITESQAAAETDPLSGLLNRRGFDRLARAMVASAQASGRSVTAAVFDLDHFKAVNDRFGHQAGDAVIVATAEALGAAAPEGALVCRMGGEEFALLVCDLTPGEARRRIESLRARIAALPEPVPQITASCGLAHRRPGEGLGELMRRADLAAYEAKRGGRDRLCVSDDGEVGDALMSGIARIAH